jgi:protein-tyrosine phosphatase
MTPAWIELEGAHNARDMGGLRTAGGRTRAGVLLRSDALDALTRGDVERLTTEVALAHVVDLRSSAERDERGRGRLGETGVRYTELEVIGPDDLERRRAAREAAFAAGRPPAEIMADGYAELLQLGAGAFVEGFRRIVEPGGAPVLVHCAAGKDRTGVMVALLLDVAGVERRQIIADYAASDGRMAPIIERLGAAASYERPADAVQAFMLGALAPTMEHFVAHLDEQWDGGAGFFLAHGVEEAALDRWRALFVEPS